MKSLSVDDFLPGGILPTDVWHIRTDDGTCSRCRETPPEEDVPLFVWSPSGEDMLRYCERCLGVSDDGFNPHGSGPVPIAPREG